VRLRPTAFYCRLWRTLDLMIAPDEVVLEGRWLVEGGRVRADATEERIGVLVEKTLTHLADDPAAGAWVRLFRDPSDGRLWELTYPQGEMHGGGPRTLRVISGVDAKRRFNWNNEV